jgi:hypothetical protein
MAEEKAENTESGESAKAIPKKAIAKVALALLGKLLNSDSGKQNTTKEEGAG